MKRKFHRCVRIGRFVSTAYANKHPSTTVAESGTPYHKSQEMPFQAAVEGRRPGSAADWKTANGKTLRASPLTETCNATKERSEL